MQPLLSRLRFRKVRSQTQLAGRPKRERSFRDSNELRFLAGTTAWLLALWLMVPAEALDWRALIVSGVALVVIGFGGQMLLAVIEPGEERARPLWLLMLVMMLLSIMDVRLAAYCLSPLFRFDATGSVSGFISPHAFVPLLVGLLYGGPVALVVGLIAGVVLALASGFNFGVLLLALCATAVAAHETPRLRYRLHIVRTLGRIALWQTPVILVLALAETDAPDLRAVLLRLGALCIWMAVSGVLVVLALPFAERMTGRMSVCSLNPYADLGQPLLQRMALEAPGTFHHAMMVANLAQAAADRIGANGLLARVGAYYHDIGKIGRPRFYIENQMQGSNPHDNLPPNISRMIIINHVKEGQVLAHLNRIPDAITRFIAVHHGTSVIQWFHRKAQRQAAKVAEATRSEAPAESHFRYSGPLPVSREETIVALADSIEAAARAMPKVTPGHIENLVQNICNAKWSDGQLDQSRLSAAELAAVRASFAFTLTHLLHARLAYPPHELHPDPEPAAPAPH